MNLIKNNISLNKRYFKNINGSHKEDDNLKYQLLIKLNFLYFKTTIRIELYQN